MFSTFPACSQIPVVFCRRVISGLGFYILLHGWQWNHKNCKLYYSTLPNRLPCEYRVTLPLELTQNKYQHIHTTQYSELLTTVVYWNLVDGTTIISLRYPRLTDQSFSDQQHFKFRSKNNYQNMARKLKWGNFSQGIIFHHQCTPISHEQWSHWNSYL